MDAVKTHDTQHGPATVRLLTIDDGKVNALSRSLLQAIHGEVDRAAEARVPLVVTGRAAVFAAGFDLRALRAGGNEAVAMLAAGARLAQRLLEYPGALVTAVNGAAMAMGAFVALGGDVRIGVPEARIAANEVAVGLKMPRFATALLRHRLTRPAFDSAAITARPFVGDDAVRAGWFDELAPAAELQARAIERAAALGQLDAEAYRGTKARIRERVLAELAAGIEADLADWRRRIGS